LFSIQQNNQDGVKKKIINSFLKKLPGTVQLNNYLLDKKVMNNFLKCSDEEKEQSRFYEQFITKNDLVFDVGCNIGSRTKIFLNLGAKVVGFEPQNDLCEHLYAHLKRNKSFSLERTALGATSEIKKIKISDAHVLSSMSDRWIQATQESGRFKCYNWDKTEKVKVTTLDEKIKVYGIPKYIKIDVEGYEYEVLKGLSVPVQNISTEFTAEDMDNSYNCIDHISTLSDFTFNYSTSENLTLSDQKWKSNKEIKISLNNLCNKNNKAWGDIYAKLIV
jgi:FkbM family methyltransferase